MFLSVFEMFKIGIGPSSSHTMGPMLAANRFLQRLNLTGNLSSAKRVETTLHGSLAFTGRGHGTARAVILGLLGETPEALDPEVIQEMTDNVAVNKVLNLDGRYRIPFREERDIVFDFGVALPGHSNGMIIRGFDASGDVILEQTYYSIGGGFVVLAEELAARDDDKPLADVPYSFRTAAEMLGMGEQSEKSIAAMKFANEVAVKSKDIVVRDLDRIWSAMESCISRGLRKDGELPGGLKVKRRARKIRDSLVAEEQGSRNARLEHTVMDWLSLYALAVNEENAAGGRVVTAPTNGAAGIIPAVIKYYQDFCPGASKSGIHDFLLTASAIGGLIKYNASISGAEVGCQGEVGAASAMAAAGLAAVLGGTNAQIENAAEIALEHHLGMTCDPVGGLVQVPCIERNAMGAVKAVNAASLALRGDGSHIVPLDTAIETMRQTGMDMLSKYKETSEGGAGC